MDFIEVYVVVDNAVNEKMLSGNPLNYQALYCIMLYFNALNYHVL